MTTPRVPPPTRPPIAIEKLVARGRPRPLHTLTRAACTRQDIEGAVTLRRNQERLAREVAEAIEERAFARQWLDVRIRVSGRQVRFAGAHIAHNYGNQNHDLDALVRAALKGRSIEYTIESHRKAVVLLEPCPCHGEDRLSGNWRGLSPLRRS